MRKRERENPCGVCGHYHKYEEGEVCGVCGHRAPVASQSSIVHNSVFPSEILKDFLYLGSYDNASRSELLKTMGISRILNTVPACQTLYKNSFTYHCLEDGSVLQFDSAIQFLEQCEKEKARVLVHCMSGKNRSPSIVIAFLMKSRGWRLAQSFQWVKDRRPTIELSPAFHQQLLEYEKKIFKSNEQTLAYQSPNTLVGLAFPKPASTATAPAFQQLGATSILEGGTFSNEFVFGIDRNLEQRGVTNNADALGFTTTPAGTAAPMDSC